MDAIGNFQHYVRTRTRYLRNWGYHEQMKSLSRDLYGELDPMLTPIVGFSTDNVITLFEAMVKGLEDEATDSMRMLQDVFQKNSKPEIVRRYFALTGESAQAAEDYIHQPQGLPPMLVLKAIIISHHDQSLWERYVIDIKTLAAASNQNPDTVTAILDAYSLSPGELSEADIEHSHLDNPIWTKPVVRLEEGAYFCALPQTFFSFIFPSLNRITGDHLSDQLSKRRARFLENKIEDIVRTRFGHAHVSRNVFWQFEGERYETDLIIAIDSYVLIVEAKSGKISKQALRGAPDRMRKHIEALFISPNQQSLRLKTKIQRMQSGEEQDKSLTTKLAIPLENIRHIIRVSVTLDDFATLQSNIYALRPTGWLPHDFIPCSTLNLAEFQILFDLLDQPVFIMHYLQSRQELEARLEYTGDEFDLMGFYINSLFEIGKLDEPGQLVITGMSQEIDQYYSSLDAGVILPKPKPKLSARFRQMLELVTARQKSYWLTIGVILCRITPDDQRRVEKMILQCEKNVRRRPQAEDLMNVVTLSPGEHSRYSFSLYVFTDSCKNRQLEFHESAARNGLQVDHVEFCLVIGINCDSDAAYTRIALAHR